MIAKFPELTYANPTDPWLKRSLIQAMETWAGRDYFVPLYERWKREFVPGPGPVIAPMLDLMQMQLDIVGGWPPKLEAGVPLVIIGNHPYGIVDGIAALSLAEGALATGKKRDAMQQASRAKQLLARNTAAYTRAEDIHREADNLDK